MRRIVPTKKKLIFLKYFTVQTYDFTSHVNYK